MKFRINLPQYWKHVLVTWTVYIAGFVANIQLSTNQLYLHTYRNCCTLPLTNIAWYMLIDPCSQPLTSSTYIINVILTFKLGNDQTDIWFQYYHFTVILFLALIISSCFNIFVYKILYLCKKILISFSLMTGKYKNIYMEQNSFFQLLLL